jgi:tRNA(Ile)-lysidine synthase TilS/MesJ
MQHILSLTRRCVEDYNMIEAGERIAVGVSGGKDSMLALAALAQLRQFYPKPFELEAITLEMGMPGMDFTPVAEYCEQIGVPYTRIQVPVYQIVFEERKEKNPCSLCAKMRRGSLNTALVEKGIRKIALGHHYDDAVETLLMNLIFQGSFGTIPPLLQMEKMPLQMIRPLCLIEEKDILRYAELSGYEKQVKLCPLEKVSSRAEVKQLLTQLEALNPNVRDSIWGAMENIKADYLPKRQS